MSQHRDQNGEASLGTAQQVAHPRRAAPEATSSPWAAAALLGSAACWGLTTVASRGLLDTVEPTTLLVLQLIASAAALSAVALREAPWRALRRAGRRATVVGLTAGSLEPGLSYVLGLTGLAMTTAGSATVIDASEPVLTVLLAWVLLGQRPERRLLLAVAVGAMGLALVTGGAAASADSTGSAAGNLLVLCAAALAAASAVASSRAVMALPTATLAALQHLAGLGVAIVSLVLLQGPAALLEVSDLGWSTIVWAGATGLTQYALATWLYLVGLRRLGPTRAGLYLATVPIFGVAGGWLWLDQAPTTALLLGGSVVVLALLISSRSR